MKALFITLLCYLTPVIAIKCAAQTAPNDTTVYTVADTKPEFEGDLYEWLAKTVRYPAEARKKDEQGRVVLQFIIEKDGSITNPVVLKSSGYPLLDEEGIQVIRQMPKWKPGLKEGNLIRIKYTLPIGFRQQ